ncbi:hypothetical protein FACS1894205_1510 [Alphaproteobacteria bacterium]|nr:hypothetical protein FACS1894205_1510 [Alphaproteobacteria bacterium]
MAILFAARSASLTKWASDVGLGKHIYLIGVSNDAESLGKSLEIGWCGVADWKVAAKTSVEGLSAKDAEKRLQKREKMVDPVFYPKLKGQTGVFRVKLENVENHIMVVKALAGQETKDVKAKTGDIARYLLDNAQKDTVFCRD